VVADFVASREDLTHELLVSGGAAAHHEKGRNDALASKQFKEGA
jgi:hypothetical protein